MTGAERYLLDALETCLLQGDIDEAEHYCAELRKELDPAAERIGQLNHEIEPNRNGVG